MMSNDDDASGSVTYRYGSSANDAEAVDELPSDVECENVGLNKMLVIESGIHSIRALAFQLSLRL